MAKTTTDSSFEFVPARAGEWTYCDLAISNEESAHAVAAVSAGVHVNEVRIDRPEAGTMGWVSTVPGTDRTAWRAQLFATLAGPLMVRRAIPWPPDICDSGDEGVCARLVLLLGLDQGAWYRVIGVVAEFLETPFAKRATTAVAGELLQRGALTGDAIHKIVDGARSSDYSS